MLLSTEKYLYEEIREVACPGCWLLEPPWWLVGLIQLISPLFLTNVSHLKWRVICFQMVRISHSGRVHPGNMGEPDPQTNVSTRTAPQGAVKKLETFVSMLSPTDN